MDLSDSRLIQTAILGPAAAASAERLWKKSSCGSLLGAGTASKPLKLLR